MFYLHTQADGADKLTTAVTVKQKRLCLDKFGNVIIFLKMASAGSGLPSDSNAGQSRYRQRTVTTTHFCI